jgi:hypothetical protein
MTSQVIAPPRAGPPESDHRHPGAPVAMKIAALVIVLPAFRALSAVALVQVGYLGLLAPHFASAGGLQVLVDLVIALALVMIRMVADARRTGRNPWPRVVITLAAGSFGPLLYLLTGALRERRTGTAEQCGISQRHASFALSPVLETRFLVGDQAIDLFTTITTFRTAQDVLAAGIRVEQFFPADARSDALCRALCEREGAADGGAGRDRSGAAP